MAKPTIERIKQLKKVMPLGMASIIKAELRPKGIYPSLLDNVFNDRVVKWKDKHDLIIATVERHLAENGVILKDLPQ